MSAEHKKSDTPGSNFQEPQPKGKVEEGNNVVKKTEDEVYKRTRSDSTYPDPAKYKENSEQPVHSIKNPPNDQQ